MNLEYQNYRLKQDIKRLKLKKKIKILVKYNRSIMWHNNRMCSTKKKSFCEIRNNPFGLKTF